MKLFLYYGFNSVNVTADLNGPRHIKNPQNYTKRTHSSFLPLSLSLALC